MSTPAQVTEAHLRLANQLVSSPPSPLVLATLIAASEAKARDQLRDHRDQLRAQVELWELAFQEQFARAERAEAAQLDAIASCDAAVVRAERAEAELATERARLKEMAAELAHCAGYIASVRTDRQITWHEELYALQTVEWAEGAVEIAEKANAVLEAHDAAMKEGAS